MTVNATISPGPRTCPRCGTALPKDVPAESCPKCLLQAGLTTQPVTSPVDPAAPAASARRTGALPQPGELFGHYRITRQLGQGGMGAVFESEDLETGRRVALKVLDHALDSPEARARFFREGRLAASVNHPNSVYVFGTEEIAGTPVIAMELVAGGTLQDRVKGQGALPFGEAVDGALQIIAGLEAAQRGGVLHRDVKPSNCFVDADGTVKIGDFGLSISTAVRTEPIITATGAYLGTPAFSSPEQLRGDELTVRSDIYAVGVTLYYLLTAHMPFQGPNMVQLLASVLERPAVSPDKWRPGLPAGLSHAVLRCLAKNPEDRFRNYAELRDALLPFASTVPTPAPLGLRFVAGALDAFLLGLPGQLFVLSQMGGWGVPRPPDRLAIPQLLLVALGSHLLSWLYHGLLEGLWGASLGKLACGLRVTRPDRNVPGIPRALLRALVFLSLPMLPSSALWMFQGEWMTAAMGDWRGGIVGLASLVVTALLFATARRRNGLAGLHDLASGTRVVLKFAHSVRPALPTSETTAPETRSTPQLGPYHVLQKLSEVEGDEVLLGFDARLLRHVWIRRRTSEVPPIPTVLRNVSRPGRLRWLNGRRSTSESWDAYEALSGQSLLCLVTEKQSWDRVRFWLLDLADELEAASRDGSFPDRLSLDRVWITADGRAKLLDFPAPGIASTAGPEPVPLLAPLAFLQQVAVAALHGRATGREDAAGQPIALPLALHAWQFLEALPTLTAPADVVKALRPLLKKPARVSTARRLALLAGSAAFPLLVTLMVGLGMIVFKRLTAANPDILPLRECLFQLPPLEQRIAKGRTELVPVRDAFEVYIAGRFRATVTNTVTWRGLQGTVTMQDPQRRLAEGIIARRPPPSPEELAQAKAIVEKHLKKTIDQLAAETERQIRVVPIAFFMGYANGLIFVVLPCLVAALLFRRGLLLYASGIELVLRDGRPASRLRVAWRNLLACLPFIVSAWIGVLLSPALGAGVAAATVTGVLAALALLSALLPERSLPDRAAGTWLVPR